MKRLLIFLSLFICHSNRSAYAQCIADAGADKAFCFSMNGEGDTTVTLGGVPSVNGGTPPYTYQWTFDGVNANWHLNNAESPNPSITNIGWFYNRDSVVFILNVTDANGVICSDDVTVRFSKFITLTSDPKEYSIHQGDSIFLSGWILTNSNFGVANYLWRPNVGLNDSTSASFWAKPDVSTTYAVKITNTVGCSSAWTACYTVNVLPPVAVNDVDKKANNVIVYPNPTNDCIYLLAKRAQKVTITVSDMFGRIYFKRNVTVNEMPSKIDLDEIKAGVYIVTMTDAQSESNRFKVVKQ